MSRATESFPRCLGQPRGVPWPRVPSPQGEDLAEEQQCGKAARELMDAEINPNQPVTWQQSSGMSSGKLFFPSTWHSLDHSPVWGPQYRRYE